MMVGREAPSSPGAAAAGVNGTRSTLWSLPSFISASAGFTVPGSQCDCPAAPQPGEDTVSRDLDSQVLAVGKKPAVGGGGETEHPRPLCRRLQPWGLWCELRLHFAVLPELAGNLDLREAVWEVSPWG